MATIADIHDTCNARCVGGVHAILWYFVEPPDPPRLARSLAVYGATYVRHEVAREAPPFGEVRDRDRYDRAYVVYARGREVRA